VSPSKIFRSRLNGMSTLHLVFCHFLEVKGSKYLQNA
jgi:hypothetical protein